MNPYVAGGYGSAAGILGAYALYVRHRVRTLVKAAPPDPPRAMGGRRSPAEEADAAPAEGP